MKISLVLQIFGHIFHLLNLKLSDISKQMLVSEPFCNDFYSADVKVILEDV